MDDQLWRTAVELDAVGGRPFVRVIESGVVSIRLFKVESEAAAFAQSERNRLRLSQIVTRSSKGTLAPDESEVDELLSFSATPARHRKS